MPNDAETPSEDAIPWPHAPPHFQSGPGTFMVTAGTYGKEMIFRSRKRLAYLCGLLLNQAYQHGWQFEAWAVFPNHYHWIGKSPEKSDGVTSLRKMTRALHQKSALWVNRLDETPERKVWHNFWDSRLTFEISYYTRLKYVMENAVRHGLVTAAAEYPWCSAGWFVKNSSPAFRKTLDSFKIDLVKVPDEF